MPAAQRNMGLFSYTDDSGQVWNKSGELDAIRNAVDGSTAFGGHPAFGRESRRRHVRKIVYQDGSTFRTKTLIFYTPTAYNAITLGTSTLSFMVEGQAVAIVYTARQKIAEKLPGAGAARNLPDHA